MDWILMSVPLFFFGYLTLMVFTAVDSPSWLLITNTLATSVVGLVLYAMPYRKKSRSELTT